MEIVFGSYLMMGDELGSATDIYRLLVVSSALTVYTNFHLSREQRFPKKFHTDFR